MLAFPIISRLPLQAGGHGRKAMRIILGVALLALCAQGKEGEKPRDEKAEITKRGFIHSHDAGHGLLNTFGHGVVGHGVIGTGVVGTGVVGTGVVGSGSVANPVTFIGSGHSNLYNGNLLYGKDYLHNFGHTNILGGIHHTIAAPAVAPPQVITRTVTVDKPFPVPHAVPVKVDRPVAVPVPIPQPYPVPINKPYPFEVVKPVAVPVEKEVPYHVVKPVPYPVEKIIPYPVEKRVYYPVHIQVERQYTVNVPKPYPVYQEKTERYPVERPVHVPVPVKVDVPVPQPVPVPVDRPYPVNVPHPVPVTVERPIPVKVVRPVPYHVINKVAVPVPHPVPVHVEKHIPIPVTNKVIVPTHVGVDSGAGIDIRFGADLGTGLHGFVNNAYQDGQFLLGSQGSNGFFSSGGHLSANDYSNLFSHSFGTDGLGSVGGATIVNIDKSIELPLKVYRSTSDKLDAEANASEPIPNKAERDVSEPTAEKAKKE